MLTASWAFLVPVPPALELATQPQVSGLKLGNSACRPTQATDHLAIAASKPSLQHSCWFNVFLVLSDVMLLLFFCIPLQALALEFGERGIDASHDGSMADNSNSAATADSTFYEITVATVDQPKLLSRLSDAMVSNSSNAQHLG